MSSTIRRTLLFAALFALGACGSPKKDATTDGAPAPVARCICGTPTADVNGCPHPLCVSGKHNPDNPECLCGPLEFENEEK